MLKVAIVGATGYTGQELVRILSGHPYARPFYLTSTSFAGRRFGQVFPRFRSLVDIELAELDEEKLAHCDFIFSALPHGLSMKTVPALVNSGRKVVDLSGDFRLADSSLYPAWYGYEHQSQELLALSVYGMPEYNRDEISQATLVANPGCYPTSVLLALKPFLAEGLVNAQEIIIDAKSGVSGAGRPPRQPFHFPECTENFKAYKVTGHQHIPEIEQQLEGLTGRDLSVTFTPHLVPMVRGILSTIYLKVKEGVEESALWGACEKHFAGEPFIRLCREPDLPETRFVSGTNFCDISLRLDQRTGRVTVVSAIDNLVKGASGQAIQNMNIMMGWPEDSGLRQEV